MARGIVVYLLMTHCLIFNTMPWVDYAYHIILYNVKSQDGKGVEHQMRRSYI